MSFYFHYLISSVVYIIILRNGIRSNIKFFCCKPFNIFSIKRDSSILKIEFKQNEYMYINFNDLRKRPRKINVVTFEKKKIKTKPLPKITQKLSYLYHTYLLSIQHHILCHTDQSRDYRRHRFYSVLHTVEYNQHRTTPMYILVKD